MVSFVLKRNGHIYEVFIDQSFNTSNNINNLNEDLREFNTEIKIRIIGYLIGEGPNDDRPIVKVEENFVEYTFPKESIVGDGFINI